MLSVAAKRTASWVFSKRRESFRLLATISQKNGASVFLKNDPGAGGNPLSRNSVSDIKRAKKVKQVAHQTLHIPNTSPDESWRDLLDNGTRFVLYQDSADHLILKVADLERALEHSKRSTSEGFPKAATYSVDFKSTTNVRRVDSAHRRVPELIKAIGWRDGSALKVADLTAGFGRDSFLMASFGCTVGMFERSPTVSALLYDALLRFRESRDPKIQVPALAASELFCMDASELQSIAHSPGSAILPIVHRRGVLGAVPDDRQLKGISFPPDVVFIDPMFSTWSSGRNAASKKDSQFLQGICDFETSSSRLESDSYPRNQIQPLLETESQRLLELASCLAKERIVIKLPRKKSNLKLSRGGKNYPPSFSVLGKSVRFDVFLLKNLK
eukprot:gb/GECG01012876.1/.p1 GENE.gb/GECG01012876.1/~~gb/GECG01012876.1/.p1  ORF type:complete len:386 (+),score=38.98 gb/GECG01012876.1/:1-1158(+)